MPPKPKLTKEKIADMAYSIIKEEGLSALTARELGKRLNTSASPIFTIFESMDEVKLSAREIALKEFKETISDYKNYTPAFKRIGMMIVSYGIHEPEMFKLLFMQAHSEPFGFKNTINDLGDLYFDCISLIKKDYSLSNDEASLLFEQMWTLAYGLGAMCAMKVCDIDEKEIGRRLSVAFVSHIMLIKSGKLNSVYEDIEKGSNKTYHTKSIDEFSIKEKDYE